MLFVLGLKQKNHKPTKSHKPKQQPTKTAKQQTLPTNQPTPPPQKALSIKRNPTSCAISYVCTAQPFVQLVCLAEHRMKILLSAKSVAQIVKAFQSPIPRSGTPIFIVFLGKST